LACVDNPTNALWIKNNSSWVTPEVSAAIASIQAKKDSGSKASQIKFLQECASKPASGSKE
jgi:hypothetical protein